MYVCMCVVINLRIQPGCGIGEQCKNSWHMEYHKEIIVFYLDTLTKKSRTPFALLVFENRAYQADQARITLEWDAYRASL